MFLDTPGLAVVETVEEGLDAKLRRPGSVFVAGGTEVVADQNLELREPAPYVSLRRIAELQHIDIRADRVTIGGGIVVARLLDEPLKSAAPLLAKAARAFGTRQVRNRATVGGNIASGLPDRTLLPCLLVLDAEVELRSPSATRRLALDVFLKDGGRTALTDEELLTHVTIKPVAGYQDYVMVGPRNAQFYPTVSVALVADEKKRTIRLGLGNAGPKAMRAGEAEAFANQSISWDRREASPQVAQEFGSIAAEHCAPVSDATAGADYRRHAVKVMARRLLSRIFEDQPS
ncbi:MAG: FAD binding domain-containing protein [Hyphomicrobiales bacterium]